MSRLTDDELLDALGVDTEIAKTSSHSPREERIIAGFEEIQRFVERYGRAPQHGKDNDIFERLYAVRLDRLRALEECRDLLVPLDYQGLLSGAENASVNPVESMDDDELLAALEGADGPSSIQNYAMCAPEPKYGRPRRSPNARSVRTSNTSGRCLSRLSAKSNLVFDKRGHLVRMRVSIRVTSLFWAANLSTWLRRGMNFEHRMAILMLGLESYTLTVPKVISCSGLCSVRCTKTRLGAA
ncbi:putative helicase [Anoxybacillus amylolyticus]|uniref:Putative helicase n=1 Tax=Anoxybacteroides amylolyticum TaxID=294699 RepID=A0A160F238_9BACL|nr:putative helicase [Anoxybacillus amylolyticus]